MKRTGTTRGFFSQFRSGTRSLKATLGLYFLPLSILPVIFLSVYATRVFEENTRQTVRRRAETDRDAFIAEVQRLEKDLLDTVRAQVENRKLIAAVAAGRPDPGPPTIEERRDVFRRHVALIGELKSGPRVLHEVRKACAWYARGLYGCNRLRIEVWAAPGVDAAVATTEAYFAGLLARRAQLGLPPEADRAEMDGAAVEDAA